MEDSQTGILADFLGGFPTVRTGQSNHGWTSHFDDEIGLFHEFLMKNRLLRAYYLGFD